MSDNNRAGEEPRTVFMPSGGASASSLPPAAPSAPPGTVSQPTVGGFTTQFAPREVGQGIQIGDVLNHIFEVKRFIARGGMGEVFEGVNINTDERVAIKVMLPQLAADPNVIGMFRKEARTLTRLNHEALVNYRVLAQEPQLGILYIVTEYVDGVNLADALGRERPTAADLMLLLRRLASGLRVAHQLGAIHRDMSPDNVLLAGGELAQAKIIDFGIAKTLDPGTKTIVGDGFAGKLNYVAPEQLGDFDREIGPWTDVYSLALVILAVALGKNVQMGGSLVDAVDKRRAGPDLSAVPEEVRPVLARMLAPNPADRLRSMDDVLTELDPKLEDAPPSRKSRAGLFVGAGGLLAAAAVAGFFLLRPHGGIQAASSDPVDVARATINANLPSVGCTWLDVSRIDKKGGRLAVSMTGVAGNPNDAQKQLTDALAGQKITNADIDFEGVSPITQSGCAALDAYRQIRSPHGEKLSVPTHKFAMTTQQAGELKGKLAANELVDVAIGNPNQDFAFIGIEPSGVITDIIANRAQFKQYVAAKALQIDNEGGDKYRLHVDVDHADWSGFLLITGKGPFEKDLVAPSLINRGPAWLNKFVSTAAAQGWQTNMVWAKSVAS